MKYKDANGQSHSVGSAVAGEQTSLPCVGRLAGAAPSGEVAVQIGTGTPTPARLMAGLRQNELSRPTMRDREVLVVFEQGDPGKPIILGLLADPLEEVIALTEREEPTEVLLDGKKVTLEAQEEILLKCGEGSITLRKDGKIIIKGTHLLSRATGPNRIKGGSVQIN
jgi:hypothetical protein